MEDSVWNNTLLKWIWDCKFVKSLPASLEEIEPEHIFPAFLEGINYDINSLDPFNPLLDFLNKIFPNFKPELSSNGRIANQEYILVYTLLWRFACGIEESYCVPSLFRNFSIIIPDLSSLTREKLFQFMLCIESGKTLNEILSLMECDDTTEDDQSPGQSSDHEDIVSSDNYKAIIQYSKEVLKSDISPMPIAPYNNIDPEAVESAASSSSDEFPQDIDMADGSSSRHQDWEDSDIEIELERSPTPSEPEEQTNLMEQLRDNIRTLRAKNEELNKKLEMSSLELQSHTARIMDLESRLEEVNLQLMDDDVNIGCQELNADPEFAHFREKLLQNIRTSNTHLSDDELTLLLSQVEYSIDQVSLELGICDFSEWSSGDHELRPNGQQMSNNPEEQMVQEGYYHEIREYLETLEKKLEQLIEQRNARNNIGMEMLELLKEYSYIRIGPEANGEEIFELLKSQMVQLMADNKYLKSASMEFHLNIAEKRLDTKIIQIGEMVQCVAYHYNPPVIRDPLSQDNALTLLRLLLNKFIDEHKSLRSSNAYFTRKYRECLVRSSDQHLKLQQEKAKGAKMKEEIARLEEELQWKDSVCEWYEEELMLHTQNFQEFDPEQSEPLYSYEPQRIWLLLSLLKDKLIGHVAGMLQMGIQINVPKIVDGPMLTMQRDRLSSLADNLKNQLMRQIAYISRMMVECRPPEQIDNPVDENEMMKLVDRLQQQINAVEDKNMHLKIELDLLIASRGIDIDLRQELRQARDELYAMKTEQLRLKHRLLGYKRAAGTKNATLQQKNYRKYAGELEQQLTEALKLVKERSLKFSDLAYAISDLKQSMQTVQEQITSDEQLSRFSELHDQVHKIEQLVSAGQEHFSSQTELPKQRVKRWVSHQKEIGKQQSAKLEALQGQVEDLQQQLEISQAQLRAQCKLVERKPSGGDNVGEGGKSEFDKQLSEAQWMGKLLDKKTKECQDKVLSSNVKLEQMEKQQWKLFQKLDEKTAQLNREKTANSALTKKVLQYEMQIAELQEQLRQNPHNPVEAARQAEIHKQLLDDGIWINGSRELRLAEELVLSENRIVYLEQELAQARAWETNVEIENGRKLVMQLEDARRHMENLDYAHMRLSKTLEAYKMRLKQVEECHDQLKSEKAIIEETLQSTEQTNGKLFAQRMEFIKNLELTKGETKELRFQLIDLMNLQLYLLKELEFKQHQLDRTKSELVQSQMMQRKTKMELERMKINLDMPKAEELAAMQLQLKTLREQNFHLRQGHAKDPEENGEWEENALIIWEQDDSELQSKRTQSNPCQGEGGQTFKDIKDELALLRIENESLQDDVKTFKELADRNEQDLIEVREEHSRTMLEYAVAINHIKRIDRAYENSENRMHRLESEMGVSFSDVYMLNSHLKDTLQQSQVTVMCDDDGQLVPMYKRFSKLGASDDISPEKRNSFIRSRQNAIIGQLRLRISKLTSEGDAIALREYTSRRKLQELELKLIKCNSELNDMCYTNGELMQERQQYISRLTDMQRNMARDCQNLEQLELNCEALYRQCCIQNQKSTQQDSQECQTILSVHPKVGFPCFLADGSE